MDVKVEGPLGIQCYLTFGLAMASNRVCMACTRIVCVALLGMAQVGVRARRATKARARVGMRKRVH